MRINENRPPRVPLWFLRAIVASGWAELGTSAALGADLLVVDGVPHCALFPRVAAVVHHGGAGTTHAVLLAGVPQLVVPHGLDQHVWARRVHALGVGPRPLARRRLSTTRLIEAVAQVLAPALAARARELSLKVQARDGAAAAIAALLAAVGPAGRT